MRCLADAYRCLAYRESGSCPGVCACRYKCDIPKEVNSSIIESSADLSSKKMPFANLRNHFCHRMAYNSKDGVRTQSFQTHMCVGIFVWEWHEVHANMWDELAFTWMDFFREHLSNAFDQRWTPQPLNAFDLSHCDLLFHWWSIVSRMPPTTFNVCHDLL